MKVYVASSFSRKDDVRAMIALLRAEGHEITYDWTDEDASGLEGDALHAALRAGAERDLKGVLAADALVVLHDDRGRGMATEFGVALAARKVLVVVGAGVTAGEMRNVFYYLPGVVHVDTPNEAAAIVAAFERVIAHPYHWARAG
jgi:hypothetical protein